MNYGKPRHHSKYRGPRQDRRKDRDSGTGPARLTKVTQRPLTVDAAGTIPAVYVKSKILHPLLYRKRVDRAERAQPGDFVAVYNADGELSGYGLYNPRSEIAVRMLWHGPELPTDVMWDERLGRAVSLRYDLLKLPEQSNACRLVHGETDGLSGMVIDQFDDVLSAEVFSLGMYQRAEAILQRLAPLTNTKHYLIQASPQFVSQEGADPPVVRSENLPGQVVIHEHGTRFRVRFEGGHKTGFFCDQRDNRKRLADFCAGKRVLDLCCYTGGFAVQAAKLGNADQVTGVDLDHVPLALARENANLNQVRVKFVQADAFAYMREMINQGRLYDVVILDPPKLIRTRAEIEEGTRKHFALNCLAMQLVAPGGVLLTCSCAGLLPDQEFTKLVVAASRRVETANGVGRDIQILAKTGAAPDHAVLGNCLETEYLKAIWAVVK
ncbi:MAG: class I SAM-dependent rRNA methyltransferase [Planctomycetales bacterium]|nr:class I SAM-dependent rRNA methyltransferase [Planctomycetales bacterium]